MFSIELHMFASTNTHLTSNILCLLCIRTDVHLDSTAHLYHIVIGPFRGAVARGSRLPVSKAGLVYPAGTERITGANTTSDGHWTSQVRAQGSTGRAVGGVWVRLSCGTCESG